jgi:hypothetical protein
VAVAAACDYPTMERFERSFPIVVDAGVTGEALAFALRSTQRGAIWGCSGRVTTTRAGEPFIQRGAVIDTEARWQAVSR